MKSNTRKISEIKITVVRSINVLIESEKARSFIPLLLVIIISIIMSPRHFTSPLNIKSILALLAPLALLALGEQMIILMGSIDLSPGSIQAATGYLAAYVGLATGNVLYATLAAMALGTLAGFINGLIITKLKIFSFVATLAAMIAWRGFVIYFSGGKIIYSVKSLAIYNYGILVAIPVAFIIALSIYLAFSILLYKTPYGRYVYAIGDNEQAAYLAGINISKAKILTFTIAGLLYGISGALYVGVAGQSADPWMAQGNELNAIASCVLGGVSLAGGVGLPFSGILGATTLTILYNILVLIGITQISLQQVAVAIVLILYAIPLTRGMRFVK